MKRLVVLTSCLVVFLLVVFDATRAMQNSDEQTSTVTLVIAPACNLGIVDNNVSKTITADSESEVAFSQGYVELDPSKPTLIIDSNKKWKLSVRSTNFTGPYSKDISDLQLKDANTTHVKNGFDDFKSLSTSDQEIAMDSGGVKDEIHPIQYKVLLDWEKDVPGTYEATVTYTLSTLGS